MEKRDNIVEIEAFRDPPKGDKGRLDLAMRRLPGSKEGGWMRRSTPNVGDGTKCRVNRPETRFKKPNKTSRECARCVDELGLTLI